MSCKDYIELKPGMEVKLSFEPWGYKNVDAVIDSVGVKYSYEKDFNCGVFYPFIVCYIGKCRMHFDGPSDWETLVIKPCRKVQVKDLCVGDVIERNDNRGMITYKDGNWVNVLWYKGTGEYSRSMSYDIEITDAELVGHVDLWNL